MPPKMISHTYVLTSAQISSLTSNRLWAIIRPSSSGDAFMTLSSSIFSILLLSGDSEIQTQFKQAFKDATMTTAKDASALPRDAAKRTFDAVIVESKPGIHHGAPTLPHHVDLSRTLVITGSKPVLKRASKFMQTITRAKGTTTSGIAPLSLEDYVEWKMGDFVKGMHNGSGRNLHPMLISAIERPLIMRALQETKGNQIQAAELLGLNRNTLRKKIHDLHIPVKRGRAAQAREA
jgi:Fis family transcriptional regulator, factor for inversion stimulation protein